MSIIPTTHSNSNNKHKLWLILPGGGAKGVFQVGFIDGFLHKYGDSFEIDRVYGTSVGAIMSPCIASRKLNILKNIFRNVESIYDIFQPWGWLESFFTWIPIFTQLGAYKKVKIVDTILDELAHELTPEELEKCYDKCHVVAWDIMNKEETWFTGKDLPIGIRASSALTIAVPPISHNDTIYTDGGITEIIPITKAIEDFKNIKDTEDKENIIVMIVDCSTRKPQKITKKPANHITYMLELLGDAAESLTETELKDAQEQHPEMKIKYFKPEKDIFQNPIDFDKTRINEAFNLGYEAGLTCSILANSPTSSAIQASKELCHHFIT